MKKRKEIQEPWWEDDGELTEGESKELINGDSFLGKPEAIGKFAKISSGWYAMKYYRVVDGKIVKKIVEQDSHWNIHGELWKDRSRRYVVAHTEFDGKGGTIFLYRPDLYNRRLIKFLGEALYWAEILSHESLHLVMYKVAGEGATDAFDNLGGEDGDWLHSPFGYVMPRNEHDLFEAKHKVLDIMIAEVNRKIKRKQAKVLK